MSNPDKELLDSLFFHHETEEVTENFKGNAGASNLSQPNPDAQLLDLLNSPNKAWTQNDAKKPIENPVEQLLTKQTSRKYRKKSYTVAQVENVISLSQVGFTATKIGNQLDIPRRTVSQWIHEPPNYLLMGSSSLSSVGSGRVHALHAVLEEEIGKLILFGRSIKCETTKQWVQDFQIVKRIETDVNLKYSDTRFQGLRKRLKKTFRLNLTPPSSYPRK